MQEETAFPKAYEPSQYEDQIYTAWEASGFFNPDHLPGERKEVFSIVLPPPNVTGTLHLGHAMMLAIEDAMVRFARLRGKKTLWLPGTDHAAIATQAKVEKLLMQEGMKDPRSELGREKFLERVRAYAATSHDTIIGQCKKMGSSLDWSREAYTLDDARSRSVRSVFKRMYDDGLIYRGHRLVNWCPRCKSTLADDEVDYKEVDGKFYWIKYGPFVLATSRPETKLGDTAVAVSAGDARYADMVGKHYQIPGVLGAFDVVVVADEAVDPAFGTGAVKVTPAHSFEDYEIAKRHGVPLKQIIDEDGRMMANCGKYAGMTTAEARGAIVADMERMGLIDHIDEHYKHNLSLCYRCGTVVEPIPSTQWFIDVNRPFAFQASSRAPIAGIENGQQVTLKEVMRHVMEARQIEMIPDRFQKTYYHWINHLRDWCISRQIWFGHQIPVWYRGEETFVGLEAPQGEGWVQDPDTLDTWFSSGLWTFSTLGWPEQTKDFETYHPTSVLETGYDILFFWVARMILMTTYTLGEVPFRQVYLHGLVRDDQGHKMSKSLGNVIDPLEVIAKYGADAVRLSLVLGTSAGNDIRMSQEKIAGFRNFTNKLWNIARFIVTTSQGQDAVEAVEPQTIADQWILSRLAKITGRVTELYERHELSGAGELLREFTWSDVADWYLEIAKIQRKQALQKTTDQILFYVLKQLLVLWHPLMPFVTETLWKQAGCDGMLMVEEWPKKEEKKNKEAETSFALLQEIIVAIRHLRALYHVEPSVLVHVNVLVKGGESFMDDQSDLIKTLARVESLQTSEPASLEGMATQTISKGCVYLSLEGLVDVQAEIKRLEKEIEETHIYLSQTDVKLGNKEFLEKAPEAVVRSMETKRAEASARLVTLEQQKDSLEQK